MCAKFKAGAAGWFVANMCKAGLKSDNLKIYHVYFQMHVYIHIHICICVCVFNVCNICMSLVCLMCAKFKAGAGWFAANMCKVGSFGSHALKSDNVKICICICIYLYVYVFGVFNVCKV